MPGKGDRDRSLRPPYMARVNPHVEGEIIDRYSVETPIMPVDVYIVDRGGVGYYLVDEPGLDGNELDAFLKVREALTYVVKPVVAGEKSEAVKYLEESLDRALSELRADIGAEGRRKLLYYLHRDFFGYERIDVLMRDDGVEEISCVGHHANIHVVHRGHSGYDWLRTNIGFRDPEECDSLVRRLVQLCGKSVTTATPIVDAITPEGHRLSVTFQSEVTLPGSTFSIRKFLRDPLTITRIISFGTLSPLMAAYLWLLLEFKGYVMVIGAMASGKTTLLNCLANLINPSWKVCTIEDTPEVQTFHEQWLRMKTRYSLFKSDIKDIDLFELVKASLRHRPDYIIVGETRGEEARILTQAATLGHGCMTTFHSGSAEDVLTRLSAPPINVGLSGLLSIWAIVTIRRARVGRTVIRRVASIDEVDPREYDERLMRPRLVRVFEWDPARDVFSPSKPEEVVGRSVRLRAAMDVYGWDRDRLIEEMRRRAEFLRSLVDRKVFSYKDVVDEIRRFYTA